VKAHAGRAGGQDSDGCLRTGSYEVMDGRPVACEWMRAPSIGRQVSGKDTRSVCRWVNPIDAGPAPILTETGAADHLHCLPHTGALSARGPG